MKTNPKARWLLTIRRIACGLGFIALVALAFAAGGALADKFGPYCISADAITGDVTLGHLISAIR